MERILSEERLNVPQDLHSLLPDDLAIETDNPLWHFALWFWQQPGMEPLALRLQDQGASVTRLLCALWLASQGSTYDGDPSEVGHWRASVTEPLRSTRKRLPKTDPTILKLRKDIAASELKAEQIELALAYQLLSQSGNEQEPSLRLAGNLRCADILHFLSDQELSALADVIATVPQSGRA